MLTRKRSQKLKNYAKEFCLKVKNDFNGKINFKEYPRLFFFKYPGTLENGFTFNGYFNPPNKIEIYGLFSESMETLKRITRHECLHFLLWQNDLPYQDKNIPFILLAIKYDARPAEIVPYLDELEKAEAANDKTKYMEILSDIEKS